MQPTESGYLSFIRNVMGITTTQLPDTDIWITWTYQLALATVLLELQVQPLVYMLAVYNFAGDRLINFAQDQAGSTFFADARTTLGINNFQAGVVASAGDQGTSGALVVPEFFQNLTMADLQSLKTPYGRQYIAFAQQYGPNVWGIS